METAGRHFMADYFDCEISLLTDRAFLCDLLRKAAKKAGATIVQEFCHPKGNGLSIGVIVEESHLILHTNPDMGIVIGDFYTCGTTANPKHAHEEIIKALKCQRCQTRLFERGIPGLL